MKQSVFPVWFRAYILIPVLTVAYFTIPLQWNFSPYALTHTMPSFLLGATDWGSGNMYTFAKIAYWIGMILGGAANALTEHPESMNTMSAIKWRLIHNTWHVAAALCLPLGLTILGGVDAWHALGAVLGLTSSTGEQIGIDLTDMWLLFGYLVIGVIIILVAVSVGQRHVWPKYVRVCVSVTMGVLWGFVPVAIGRP